MSDAAAVEMPPRAASSKRSGSGPAPVVDPPMVSRYGWLCVGLIGVLFVALHSTFIFRMFRIATNAYGQTIWEAIDNAMSKSWNQDWSHALVIPFVSVFYIVANRQELMARPIRVFWPALPFVFLSIANYIFWIYPGGVDMFQGWSIMVVLFFIVLWLLGPHAMRVLWFPIAFLFFAVKLSHLVWEYIVAMLQQAASSCASILLTAIGLLFDFEADNRGTAIYLTFRNAAGNIVTEPINIAEACSGIRMLMAFIALGVAIAFFVKRPLWQRLIVVATTLPVAVLVNVGRVTVISLLYMVNKDYAGGDFHVMIGLFMLVPAGILFLGVGWVVDHLFVKPELTDEQRRELEAGPPVHATWLEGSREDPLLDQNRKKLLPAILTTGGGTLVGVVMMLLFGAAVGCFILWRESNLSDFLGVSLSGGQAGAGMIGAVAVLVVCYIAVWRFSGRSGIVPRHLAAGVCMGILLTGAIGFERVKATTEMVLFKEEVPLRYQFYHLPTDLPQWVMIGEQRKIPKEIEDELGTLQHLTRTYAMKGSDLDPQESRRGRIGVTNGAIQLHVAYYTGMADTVPHVPDRCFVANGAQSVDRDRSTPMDLTKDADFGVYSTDENGQVWATTQDEPFKVRVPSDKFDVTRFTYRDPTTSQLHNVYYFFAANGRMLSGPNQVRYESFNIRDRYAYYCKIEMRIIGLTDAEESTAFANAFLSDMMPEILRCLPDWTEVEAGNWPEDAAGDDGALGVADGMDTEKDGN